MFGKSKGEKDQVSFQVQQPQLAAAKHSGEQASTDQASSIASTTPPEILEPIATCKTKEREMFGKSKDEKDQVSLQVQQSQLPAAKHSGEQASTDQASSISRGMTVVGKIFDEGTVQVFGHIEGELRALTVLINEGAQIEGDVVAEELTIAGQIKGTIHAHRVKLNSTAVVEGDIFHRSLSIEENARFEGSSKREDNAVDVPHIPLRRPTAQDDLKIKGTAIEGNRKSNGAPAHDGHTNAGGS